MFIMEHVCCIRINIYDIFRPSVNIFLLMKSKKKTINLLDHSINSLIVYFIVILVHVFFVNKSICALCL